MKKLLTLITFLVVSLSIGLFSLKGTNSAVLQYQITSPIFDEVTVTLAPEYYKADKFVIRSAGNSPENCYLHALKLDGEPLVSPQLSHSRLAQGGVLEPELAGEPNRELVAPVE